MRLVPNTDTVPASVNRYLLPHERQVITVHQHPAVLIRRIFEVLIGLAVVITSLYPGMTVLLARWVLGERMRWLQRAGLLLATAGVVLLTALPGEGPG